MIFNISTGPARSLPVLDSAYPQNVSTEIGGSAAFEVRISQDGKPAEYTYQWYYDGNAVPGATGRTYTRTAEKGTHSVRCSVTSKAGTVFSRTATVTADTLYLYKNGTIYPIAGDFKMHQGKNFIEKQANQLYMRSTGHNVWDDCYFTNLIDLTPYKTLYLEGSVAITGSGETWGQFEFGAYTALNSGLVAGITGAKAQGTHSIDVSKLTGKYYISFCLKGFASYVTAYAQKVYLK